MLARVWQEVRRPLAYATIAVGVILGVTALGMVTRGLLVEESVPVSDLLVTLVGAGLLVAFGVALRVRAPG